MGRLVDGEWHERNVVVSDGKGNFVRQSAAFRDRITADGSSGHPAVAGRYRLYVAFACPWAHRTLIGRALYGLQDAIPIAAADAFMSDEHGWDFRDGHAEQVDEVEGIDFLYRLYQRSNPTFTGRATVPVLWDREAGRIVNNESREILRMMGTELGALATRQPNLAPASLRAKIDETIDAIYQPINNGVYRAGFAGTQEAHETAVRTLFEALDHWERVLGGQRWLVGDTLTDADICMFTTLYRFDSVYATHFKCNIRRIVDYPNLWAYTRAIYQRPGVADTCKLASIKAHYYRSHTSINPRQLVPLGPDLDFDAPHDRG